MAGSQRAVVIGGSVAGLCAAAALSESFAEVVVLERDDLSGEQEHRRGVPQARHPHFLLDSGRAAIEQLCPGFEKRLLGAGGMELDPLRDTAYLESRGWAPRKRGSMTMIYSSRALLERVLRECVEEFPNVDVRGNTQVFGLAFGQEQRPGVAGVHYGGDGAFRSMAADLVVDATGRGSRCAGWIEDRGVGRVPVRKLDARVMYSSRWYQEPDPSRRPADWWWQHMAVLPDQRRTAPDEHQYLCTIFPVENGRWIAFMGAWGLDLPTTPADFVGRAGKVRTPLFSRALAEGTPLSKVYTTRSTANVWRRFDLLDPVGGFVALGDAVCAFNPLYGQGMSAAAVSATLLKHHLATGDRADLPQRFFRDQAEFLRMPWSLATLRDGAYEHAAGTEISSSRLRRRLTRTLSWPVFNLLSGAAREDAVVQANFSRVYNMQQPLGEMLSSPRVLAGLAWYQIKRWTRTTRLPGYGDPTCSPPATDHTPGTTSPEPT